MSRGVRPSGGICLCLCLCLWLRLWLWLWQAQFFASGSFEAGQAEKQVQQNTLWKTSPKKRRNVKTRSPTFSLSHSLTHTLSFTHTHTHSPSHYMSSEIILEMQRCLLLQLLIQVLERTPVEMIKKRGQRLLGRDGREGREGGTRARLPKDHSILRHIHRYVLSAGALYPLSHTHPPTAH